MCVIVCLAVFTNDCISQCTLVHNANWSTSAITFNVYESANLIFDLQTTVGYAVGIYNGAGMGFSNSTTDPQYTVFESDLGGFDASTGDANLASTTYVATNNVITSATTSFNNNISITWSTDPVYGGESYAFDLLTVALHELGHAIGLCPGNQHSTDASSIMYGSFSSGPNTEYLTSDVLTCIPVMYPGTDGVCDVCPPYPPTGLSATIIGQNVILHWDTYTDPTAWGFEIYRNNVAQGWIPTSQTSYTDANAAASLPATYKVAAFNGYGSSYSPLPVEISLSPSTISSYTIWRGIIYINSEVTVQSGAQLVIGSGTEVVFNAGNSYGIIIHGTLNAQGSQSNPILFTSNQTNPSASSWDRIYLYGNGNNLSYCNFSGGGRADLLVLGSGSTISNCTFQNATMAGLNVSGSGSNTISNCTMQNNGYGLQIYGYNPVVNRNTIKNNTSYGVIVSGYAGITNFTNNIIEHNGGNGLYVGGGAVLYMGNGTGSYQYNGPGSSMTPGAGINRIDNNCKAGNSYSGSTYEIFVDNSGFLYAGQVTNTSAVDVQDGFNTVFSSHSNYIYNLAMTGPYESQQQWTVPAEETYWGPNGLPANSGNFYGSVNVSYTITFDPTSAIDGPLPSSMVSSPGTVNEPGTVMTSSIAEKIASFGSANTQQQFYVDLKNSMADILSSLNDPKNADIRPRLLSSYNGLLWLDPNDVTQEKSSIASLLAGYREELASGKELDSTERLCGEAALVCETENAIRKGDMDGAQNLLKQYSSMVQNDDNRRALLFAEETVDENLGQYIDAMKALIRAKSIQWTVQKRKYVSPPYDFIENNLLDKAKAAGVTIKEQQIREQLERDGQIAQTVPTEVALMQNYPNPFNPTTMISYQLPSAGRILLRVYDILGREVATLAEGTKEAGYYSATFNGSTFASGLYFVRLSVQPNDGSKSYSSTMKMLMLK